MSEDVEFEIPEGWHTYAIFLRVKGPNAGIERIADLWTDTARGQAEQLGVVVGNSLMTQDEDLDAGAIYLLAVAAPPEGMDHASERVESLLERLLALDEPQQGLLGARGSPHGFYFYAPDDDEGDLVRVGNGLVRDRDSGTVGRFPAAADQPLDLPSLMAFLEEHGIET